MSRLVCLVLAVLLLFAGGARADARVVLYGHLLSPQNSDANEVSRDGFGIGLSGAIPMDSRWKLTAITGGIEYTNLLSDTEERRDPDTLLRTQVETSQGLFRLFLGGELGLHGLEGVPVLAVSASSSRAGLASGVLAASSRAGLASGVVAASCAAARASRQSSSG